MRITHLLGKAAVITLGASALTVGGLASTAQAQAPADAGSACVRATGHDSADAARGGHAGLDHRDISVAQQRAIEARTDRRLDAMTAKQKKKKAQTLAASVPVYVHVMRDAAGNGDVTDSQINQQIAVLNNSFGGGGGSGATDTGFSFTLAGVDRYNNNQWHQDLQSESYRSQTRQGGANALNIWLVDFDYLGIATFPWDYSSDPDIDGIRVQYSSLPGGSAAPFDLGETATHEAGHWLGLYHTFQGGCTSTNDEVSDTPAQASPTSGCPSGRDSCSLPGLDPIHNYMDYSDDACYTNFTSGQSSRMSQMWAAYRA
jgi:Pregnancy-associated plasma protein-A